MDPTIDIIKWAADEVERQHDGPKDVLHMLVAWQWAHLQDKMHLYVDLDSLIRIAYYMKPEVNPLRDDGTNYRRSELTFVDSTKANEVPRRIGRLMEFLPEPGSSVEDIEGWIKELLIIHPWADGNGRTACVAYNWMRGTLEDPMPLPYFFDKH